MTWFTELFSEPTYLQTTILLSLICAVGLSFAQIKIKGITLGVTFVFFAGIIAGHLLKRFGIDANWAMVSFAQNFGLIIFVYTLGLQVGPGFFASLKRGGIKLNLIGFGLLLLTTIFAVGIFAISHLTFPDTMGLLCGAVTNTPMLGASQQALLDAHPDQVAVANNMATACAVGYPMGVLGVLFSLVILKATVARKGKATDGETTGDTYVAEFHVSNPAILGKSLREITQLTSKHIIVSRIWRDGEVTIPEAESKLLMNDHLLCVLNRCDVDQFSRIFGATDSTDWNRPDIDWNHIDSSNLISSNVFVTKSELNGVKIGSLNLRRTLGINITRINRAGISLVAYPSLRLQVGDRVTVVGPEKAIVKVSEVLGNQEKELRSPNLIALFVGVLLGVVLGTVPIAIPGISNPIKLGIAGGPIIVGILMGAFGPRVHLTTYTTRSANLMLRQIGITIYLAGLGLNAGGNFFETVWSLTGLQWVLVSFAIALIPTLVTGIIAARFLKLDFAPNAGTICASMANPIALTYANAVSNDQEASEAYATVYPLSMFMRVISAQILMLLFAV